MNDADLISIALLPAEIRQATGANPPSYRSIYADVLNGKIPAERVRGRWYVRKSAVADIAAALGITNSMKAA